MTALSFGRTMRESRHRVNPTLVTKACRRPNGHAPSHQNRKLSASFITATVVFSTTTSTVPTFSRTPVPKFVYADIGHRDCRRKLDHIHARDKIRNPVAPTTRAELERIGISTPRQTVIARATNQQVGPGQPNEPVSPKPAPYHVAHIRPGQHIGKGGPGQVFKFAQPDCRQTSHTLQRARHGQRKGLSHRKLRKILRVDAISAALLHNSCEGFIY